MSQLQHVQTPSSHQDKDQNKMIAKLRLKLEQLNAYDKELKLQISDFNFKIYDEVDFFEKQSDYIRSIVQFKARRTKKYEESPERNRQILHESSENHPPPVKPSRLKRFLGSFKLRSRGLGWRIHGSVQDNSELDLDNIAQFSEPRENRCTYA